MTDEAAPATGAYTPPDNTPEPTIGRIVHYTEDVGEEHPVTLAAVVTGTGQHPEGTFDDLDSPWHAHLTVFTPGKTPHSKTNVPWDGTGSDPGTWRWPERV